MSNENETATEGKDRQIVTALARGLSVLRCFRQGDRFLGNQEIAERAGLPKATVSRLTHTLTVLGYLNHSKRFNQYSLGAAVLSLGHSMRGNLDILKSARPLMQELADHAEASVSLAARDGLHMVYLENCVASANMITLRIDVGARTRIANTAMGRALLCKILGHLLHHPLFICQCKLHLVLLSQTFWYLLYVNQSVTFNTSPIPPHASRII